MHTEVDFPPYSFFSLSLKQLIAKGIEKGLDRDVKTVMV